MKHISIIIAIAFISAIFCISCGRGSSPFEEIDPPVVVVSPAGKFLMYKFPVDLSKHPDLAHIDWAKIESADSIILLINDASSDENTLNMVGLFDSFDGNTVNMSLFLNESNPLISDHDYRATLKVKINHESISKIFSFSSEIQTNSEGSIASSTGWRLLYSKATKSGGVKSDDDGIGSGTKDNPFIVSDDTDLYVLHTDMEDDVDKAKDYYFVQSGDISLRKSNVFYQDQGWVPLCDGFRGHYDGNNHFITDLKVERSSSESIDSMGFFKHLGKGAVIENLSFDSPTFINCGNYVGTVAAAAADGVTLRNIWINAGDIEGSSYIGGLVGKCGNITINNCIVNNTHIRILNEADNEAVTNIGGLIGSLNDKNGTSYIYKNYLSYLIISTKLKELDITNVGGTIGKAICPKGLELRSNYYENSTLNFANTSVVVLGGFVGRAEGSMLVNNCTFFKSVSSETAADGDIPICSFACTGGVVGVMKPEGSGDGYTGLMVLDCVIHTAVSSYYDYVGGVAGEIIKGSGDVYINNTSLDKGFVIGQDYVGGYIGSSVNQVYISADQLTGKYYQSLPVTGSAFYTGGVIGYCAEDKEVSTIKNIKVNADVKGETYVGGFGGYMEGPVDVNNCDFATTATVSGDKNVGGILGKVCDDVSFSGNSVFELYVNKPSSKPESDNVGGIIGNAYEVIISGVTFKGKVSGYENVGGIIGWAEQSVTIKDCHNTGSGVDGGYAHVGGIVGCSSFNTMLSIDDCSNTAPIKSSSNCVGGIIGGTYKSKEDGDNNSSKLITITYCSNNGKITGKTSVGGILGFSKYWTTIENCVNGSKGKITGDQGCGGIVGEFNTHGNFIQDGGVRIIGKCANYADVSADEVWAGGIVGCMYQGFKMTECFNSGFISADKEFCGGMIGLIDVGSNVEQFPKGSQYMNNCLNTGDSKCPSHRGGMIGRKDADVCANRFRIRKLVNMSDKSGWGIFGGLSNDASADLTKEGILYNGTSIEDAVPKRFYKKWRQKKSTLTKKDIYKEQNFSTSIWKYPSDGSYPSLKNVPDDVK